MNLIIQEFPCDVVNGKLILYDKDFFNSFILSTPNCEGVLEFRAVSKNKRTTKQNKYYWGVIVKYFQRIFYDISGDDDYLFDKDLTHEQLKARLLFKEINGEKYARSSKRLSTAEWEHYCERCRNYAMSRFRVYIPLPRECNIQ